jgi:large subunit ribosomal protein L13
MNTKTTVALKPADVDQKWIVIDAKGVIVGRLASFIALRLRGKHRPDYTPNVDCGDHVIVVNAHEVKFTGRKLEQKIYYRHTGHPGGVKQRKAGQVLDGKFPERILEKAVERMLPKESPLARAQRTHLRL